MLARTPRANEWKPQPFVFEKSGSIRYIDFEKGDDANSGEAPETPWKHHPWDPSAAGKSATGAGVHTYVFKGALIWPEYGWVMSGPYPTPVETVDLDRHGLGFAGWTGGGVNGVIMRNMRSIIKTNFTILIAGQVTWAQTSQSPKSSSRATSNQTDFINWAVLVRTDRCWRVLHEL